MRTPEAIRLARPIDPAWPTNRWILILAAVAGLAGAGVAIGRGAGALAVGHGGVFAALATLLSWASCRELLPDRHDVAFVAAPLGFALAVFVGPPSLLGALTWLLVLRVANRSPGAASSWIDTATVLGLSGWIAWQGGVVLPLAAGVAMLVDGLEREPVRRHRWTAAIGLALAVLGAVRESPAIAEPVAAWSLVAAAIVTVGFGGALVVTGRPRSVGDRDGRPLDPVRVVAAQLIGLFGGLGALALDGSVGFVANGPLWAGLAGAAVAVWPRRLPAPQRGDTGPEEWGGGAAS